MTALNRYTRLEAEGIWRDAQGNPPREVFVAFGNATLVITAFSEAPLAHWALAAVTPIAREDDQVTYAPDAEGSETLTIRDPLMIEAIAAVSASLQRRKGGRHWRQRVGLLIAVATLIAAVVLGPGLLREQAPTLVSPEQRLVLSDRILDEMRPRICAEPNGQAALTRLQTRLGIDPQIRFHVARLGAAPIARLPDGSVLIDAGRIDARAGPEALAGWIALGARLGPEEGPLVGLIGQMSAVRLVAFYLNGTLSPGEINQMARDFGQNLPQISAAKRHAARALLEQFSLDPQPFLRDLQTVLPIAGDPGPPAAPTGGTVSGTMLSDQDWVALLEICQG